MAVFDGQIPIEYRYKVILAAGSCDRSPTGIPANNPGRNCSIWEERNRQASLKTLYLKGCRHIFSEVRSASLTKPNFHHTSQCPSITKSHQTYHVPETTDITVSSSTIEENNSIQLNSTSPMPTIPLLPTQLVVTTIFNSIESLGFTNIAGKVFPGEQAESRPEANLKVSTKKFYIQGLKNLQQLDLHGAIKNFTATININPQFASAYNDRGVARYKLGYKQSATEDLTTAIELNPYRAKYYTNRAFMLTRLKDYTVAIADYNSALLLNPNVAQSYFNRGAICLQMENSLAALADFESAIRLDSDFAKAYFNRGVTRYKLREVQGAFEDFQKAAGLFKLQGRMDSYQDAVSKIRQLWY